MKDIKDMEKSEIIEEIIASAKSVTDKKNLKGWKHKAQRARLAFMKTPREQCEKDLEELRRVGPKEFFSESKL